MLLWRCQRCGALCVRDERREEDDGALIQEYHDHPDGSGHPMECWTAAGLQTEGGPAYVPSLRAIAVGLGISEEALIGDLRRPAMGRKVSGTDG